MAKKNLAKHFPKLIRAILQSPCCNTSAVELVFIKIAWKDSTPATFPPRSFCHNYIKIFSALLLKYLTWAPFMVKLWAVHYRVTGQKFTKTDWPQTFFLKLFFLRQLILGAYSEENLWLSLLIVKLLPSHCSLATLLK